MQSIARWRWRWVVGVVALLALALSVTSLLRSTQGLTIEHFDAGPIPITIFHDQAQAARHLVVVAHGFAGSRPMMQQFAVSLAQNGYLTATFDFSGHGRNRVPLTGDLQSIDGATQVLVNDMGVVVAAVRERFPELLTGMAVVGHSMASDLVVRYAQRDSDVMATVGVAMFSPAVTANSPRNLLVINGEWEPRLNAAGHDVLAQVEQDKPTTEGVTYGQMTDGTARRMVLADNAEHIGVLFSVESAKAALTWLNQVFASEQPVVSPQPRGRWILLLIASIVCLWWSLTPMLPRVANGVQHGGMSSASAAVILLVPMIATPLILSFFTISFLPVLVGDYLAVHLALYGVITVILTLLFRRRDTAQPTLDSFSRRRFLLAVLLLLLLSLPLGAALHWQVASFVPTLERLPLLLAVSMGTLCWFMADEWATRSNLQWRWAYFMSKLAFLLSLGIAVALDFDGLFFLLLIVPIMVPVLAVFGLLSRWSHRFTGCATAAGVSNALFLAWAIAVTFPWVGAA